MIKLFRIFIAIVCQKLIFTIILQTIFMITLVFFRLLRAIRYFIIPFGVCFSHFAFSQSLPQGVISKNFIYQNNIKAVQFGYPESPNSLPILYLGAASQVWLFFDDIAGDIKNYTYTIFHCDANWQPSNLMEMDYIDGFNEGTIRERRNSFRTKMNFVHYELPIPNDDIAFKKSGNYLLIVYENEDDKTPVITRRFMVAEDAVEINAEFVNTVASSKRNTHHEIDFEVYHKGFDIRNPQVEVQATIIQNNFWEGAITGLPPLFVNFERLIFNYQDKVVFPALKEFRYVDLRSTNYKTDKVFDILERDTFYELILYKDKKRGGSQYSFARDMNGEFVIQDVHENDGNTESDYVRITLSLLSPAMIEDADVYVLGGITDWQINENSKMRYDDITKSYYLTLMVKQGYYEYQYVTVPKGSQKVEFDDTEDTWYEAEDDYTILVYYRPFGARFDRLIGVRTINSLRR